MTRTRRPEIAARDAWQAYRRLQLLVDAEVARDLERESGLSLADYEVLAAVVAMSDGEHCIRVGRLTARMGWAHSRLSRQLGRMERRGLISREPCELDGRGDDVLLTDSGRRAHEKATPAHLASVHRHLTGLLAPEQLDALIGIERTVTDRR
ncbi:MarR family transcriptional regulator [Actinomadura sp. 6K520]|jgi:DNA-binding MarR family transcriptional regulator|uniref:MarR family winged helix-turn-helix transcriptional regulator n=1 Tax=Actinomadura sp. 6K520 TaxID=2530364 RepID=UPI0010529E02|nr:MarR family transcriptional regulator [Actinomadura sp. 6K520]TDE27592.1 MarR family transcriptional regulator [Actinomadura sp. 6K520]